MNLPPDHIAALKSHLGNEFDELERAYETTGPTSIRINPLKWNFDARPVVPDYARTDRVLWCESGHYLAERPSFTHDPLFHAGCYYVQEASSMFLSHVAKTVFPKDEPLKVLDLCAAPGGKSTLLLSELNDDSLLVSNEVIRSRAHILAENVAKWGKANVVVANNDPEQFEKLSGFFDVIVVDAPCSGEGLFRRDPELTKEWSPANVNLCSARQRRIVLDIWSSLKEGGLLVYSTCTFNTQENEENLAWLKSQIGFESVKLEVPDEWNVVLSSFGSAQYDKPLESRSVVRPGEAEGDKPLESRSVVRPSEAEGDKPLESRSVVKPGEAEGDKPLESRSVVKPGEAEGDKSLESRSVVRPSEAEGDESLESRSVVRLSGAEVDNTENNLFAYRFYPHRAKGEGFFISVLRKTEAQSTSSHKEKSLFPPAPSKEKNEVATWLKDGDQFDFIRRGDHVLAIQKQHTDSVHRLSRTLNCVQYGIPVADAQKGLKPLHELALSVHLNKDAFHQTELSKEDALKFLAKVDFKVNSDHKGISLMMYEGMPLGWMNLLGNRANNLYPKEWRIRRL